MKNVGLTGLNGRGTKKALTLWATAAIAVVMTAAEEARRDV
jgi:hypothetical protein